MRIPRLEASSNRMRSLLLDVPSKAHWSPSLIKRRSNHVSTQWLLTPHTAKHIGTLNAKGEFITLVPRYTSLPTRRIFEFGNAQQGQTQAYFALYEGEHEIVTEEIPAPPREPIEGEEDKSHMRMRSPRSSRRSLSSLPTSFWKLSCHPENGTELGVAKIEATLTIESDKKLTLFSEKRRVQLSRFNSKKTCKQNTDTVIKRKRNPSLVSCLCFFRNIRSSIH